MVYYYTHISVMCIGRRSTNNFFRIYIFVVYKNNNSFTFNRFIPLANNRHRAYLLFRYLVMKKKLVFF